MSDEEYAGSAALSTMGVSIVVDARLSGRVEPLDGRYHWAGRIGPDETLDRLVRDGVRTATLRIDGGAAAEVRLGDVDPWGAVRVTSTSPRPWPVRDEPSSTEVDIAIVGAGFGGLGAAIKLRQAGFGDFVVLDQADDVGGTWRANTYPGIACDVPSHLYSFSFALNPDWSDTFSGGAEIWAYLRRCVDRFGIGPHLRFGHRVHDAAWDGEARRWRIDTSHGQFTARVLISAAGPLNEPSIPDIPGLASFQGSTFHSAQWRHDVGLTGRRVAVIGTGASAAQFIPQIAPQVASLAVFQRTAAWVLPRASRPISRLEKAVYRTVPGAQRMVRTGIYCGREATGFGFLHPWFNRRVAQRLADLHRRRQVPDPALRAKLTPDYVMGCKRVVVSSDYLPTFSRSNVDLVVGRIERVTPQGIVTADGSEHQVDTIIFGTGFHVTDPAVMRHIRGRDGRSLAETWTPSMRAYLGTAVAGFPNLFLLLGPNTGLGHTSVLIMLESQLDHIVAALRHMRRTATTAIEPTPGAQRRFTDLVDARTPGTVWVSGGCRSWYLDASGHNSTIWPGFATGFRLRLRRFRPADYQGVPTWSHRLPARQY